jgi:hypothetical protein
MARSTPASCRICQMMQPGPAGHWIVSSIHHDLCDSEMIHGTASRLALAAARSARIQLIIAAWLALDWDQYASESHIMKCTRPSVKE